MKKVYHLRSACLRITDSIKFVALSLWLLLATANSHAQAPNSWMQKADIGSIRNFAAGFSIGSKGYIGTGVNPDEGFKKDFWEYDPATDSWTQKADFGGTARDNATGFSVNGKGYIGLGEDTFGPTSSFYEYDPTTNSWAQKADFGGTPRTAATGFSISGKGYIGLGNDGLLEKDFWAYDPLSDSWSRKADFGGSGRFYAVGFSINDKGYLGTGFDGAYTKDFWEYNPAANMWTQKADYAGTPRYAAAGFATTQHGYIGTGYDGTEKKSDFYEYDPDSNAWNAIADFGGIARSNAIGFSISGKGYVGIGLGIADSFQDFWEYTPALRVSAGADTTVYYGYAPAQCTVLTASANGGTAPYQYTWSDGALTAIHQVCPTATTIYTVTVRDANGYSENDEVTVSVVDVRCGKSKVTVCHGNKTICISSKAVPAHLALGDALGGCTTANSFAASDQGNEKQWILYPNPTSGSFRIETSENVGRTEIQLANSYGRILFHKELRATKAGISETIELDPALHEGMYFINVISEGKTERTKLILMK